MSKKILLAAFLIPFMVACTSVPMESKETSAKAKTFDAPAEGFAGLYVYRDSFVGKAIKKELSVNDECLGTSAPDVFFYKQLPGDTEYTISTESEFSPNTLRLLLEKGKNHFVRQYIKFGVFMAGANLEVIEPEKAMQSVSKLELAKSGNCNQSSSSSVTK